MSNEFLDERQLIYLTYRSKEAIEEIEAITRSFLWNMVSVHDVEQLDKQLSKGGARVVLVDCVIRPLSLLIACQIRCASTAISNGLV
jgi:hypothetical protein